jgi:hypothetical protein
MKGTRIVGLVIGCLVLITSIGLLLGGGALVVLYGTQRDDDGYFDADLARLDSSSYAITTEEIDLGADSGPPEWLRDLADVTVRLRVTPSDGDEVFVGIGRAVAVRSYLDGVAHDEIDDVDDDSVSYIRRDGTRQPDPAGEQPFWTASASGTGTQELTWEPEPGRWSVVVMNADAAPGVSVTANVAAKAGVILAVGIGLLVAGVLGAALGALLVAWSVRGPQQPAGPAGPPGPGDAWPAAPAGGPGPAPLTTAAEPAQLSSYIDLGLSRWQWLVKWFLAIPHLLVLAFLWLAFSVLTVIAGFAILFTGRYPRSLFDFNLGVLRWTWRVHAYAFTGGVSTDRYPPFTLGPVPDYPATLDVAYPERLSRGLVLVKWWLLAIPHYLVLSIVVGGGWFAWESGTGDGDGGAGNAGPGLLAVLVLIAAVTLLFTGRYPRPLFDLIVGLNRWVLRVVAYAALMTDRYPPFRLDQGGTDPAVPLPPAPPVTPAAGAATPPPPQLADSGARSG